MHRPASMTAAEGDHSKTIAATLVNDNGTRPDLTGKSITLRMEPRDNDPADSVIEVSGLIGDAEGNVSTVIPGASLKAGVWVLDWRVIDGLTYPGSNPLRPVLVIRPEVSDVD